MAIIALMSGQSPLWGQLREGLQVNHPEWEIEVHHSCGTFRKSICACFPSTTAVVLLVECEGRMEELLPIQQLLSSFRLVLIANMANKELTRQAHLLRPRLVVDVQDAPEQVPTVLERLLEPREWLTKLTAQRGAAPTGAV